MMGGMNWGKFLLSKSYTKIYTMVASIMQQLRLLAWKTTLEKRRSWGAIVGQTLIPLSMCFLLIVIYEAIAGGSYNGIIDQLFMPVGLVIVIPIITTTVVSEKSTRLLESMKMMGLSETAYFLNLLLIEGVAYGFLVGLFIACFAISGYIDFRNGSIPSAAMEDSAASARINYFLLTSSNMSTQAWGTLQNVDKPSPQIAISSYELGVLFHNAISTPALVHAGITTDGAAGRRLPADPPGPPRRRRASGRRARASPSRRRPCPT